MIILLSVNFSEEKLFNEKITDCILCWTMPIYSGHKDIKKYFPEDSRLNKFR